MIVLTVLLFSFPAYAYPASSSNLEKLEELEELNELEELEIEKLALEELEEAKQEYFDMFLYRLDLVISLLAMLFGCLCACIFSIFWRFR